MIVLAWRASRGWAAPAVVVLLLAVALLISGAVSHVAAQLREEGYEADNVEGGMPRAQAEVYAEAVAGATGVPVNQVVFVFPRAGSEVALSLLSGVSTVRDNG